MNMNQYGNNLIAPYGQQNDYSPFFYGRNGIQQQQNNTPPTNNLLWVQGYQDIYKELFNLNKIADCKEIDLLISDVKEEVCKAEQYHLEKISTNYNMTDIVEEQKKKGRVI